MFNSLIKKVVARDGEREILESDVEEMHKFVVEGIRPEFDDKNVICVKFLQSYCETEEPEGTVWYINPYYSTNRQGDSNMFDTPERGYGPFMDTSFIPEILLVNIDEVDVVIKKYSGFNSILDYLGLENASDEEKLSCFIAKYKEIEC